MSISIYHQFRSTYVFGTHDADAAVNALAEIGITQWTRHAYEPLHFDRDFYVVFGHHDMEEALYGFRFIGVERPEGMRVQGWEAGK